MKIDFISDINKEYAKEMNYESVDRFIVRVHWWSFGTLALMAFLASVVKIAEYAQSPFSWRVISQPQALYAVLIGLIATLIVVNLRGKVKNHYFWRLVVTTTLTIFAYLFVFIAGGAIEMHFIFFAMIALIVIYSDWRLGWVMLVLVGLHHGILNYLAPFWVYQYGQNDLAFFAHALPVFVTVIFTTILCNNNRLSVVSLKEFKSNLEKMVGDKTKSLENKSKDLETKIIDLDVMNQAMVGREMKMIELKKELEELKKAKSN